MAFDVQPERRRIVLAAVGTVLVVFALAGLARLNPFCLLEPDSPDYLTTARSLVTLQGYVEIDHPDRPPHAFRPPGLPLLLMPVVGFSPGNVPPAKGVVLVFSLAALGCVAWAAWRIGGPLAGIVSLLLVATSPYTLLHAGEIVSEMPYLAALLGSLLLVTADREPTRNARVAMAALLAMLPLLRTVGLVWVLALAAYDVLFQRGRWRMPVAFALVVNAAWMVRNQRTGVVTYFSGMVHDYRELGVVGYASRSLDAAAYYAGGLLEVLLPGVFTRSPLYERFLLEPAPTLGGLAGVAYVVAVVVLVLAAAGCVARRRAGGWIVLAYMAGYLGILVVYPPRHERLIWPLVPLIWIYAPAGFALLREHARSRTRLPAGTLRAVAFVTAALTAALVAWQSVASASGVAVNLAWRRAPAEFHELTVPPVYYADWRSAGHWLARRTAGSESDVRVLTRHSDLNFSSGLPQDSIRFEEISPAELHRRIGQLKPRYLAMPATRFRWLAPWHLLQGSPIYRFVPVYEDRDVLLVEVLPNREGRVPRVDPGLQARVAACRAASRRLPHREDVRRRLGELLQDAGHGDEAIAILQGLTRAEGLVSLARVQTENGDTDAAVQAYTLASRAPGAQALSGTIERGLAGARRMQELVARPVNERIEHHLQRAAALMQALLFDDAWRSLERAEALLPQAPAAAPTLDFARGALSETVGDYAQAESRYRAAARSGAAAAEQAYRRLQIERSLLSGARSGTDREWLAAASERAGSGHLGRALLLLERGVERHPQSAPLRARLGELRAFYGPLADETRADQPG